MTQAEQPSSQVVPLLVAALVCDVAVADPGTNKKNLIGIFDRVNVGEFPTRRPMSIYFKISDAEGRYDFEVRYVEVNSGDVLARASGQLNVSDRLASHDLYITFPPLLIRAQGRHEFQIWANSMFLGSTFIDAVPRQSPAAGG